MSEPKHSPTPWRVGDSFVGERTIRTVAVRDTSGMRIATCYGHGNEPEPEGFVSDVELEANAAHIVRCVNSHDKLVEVLRRYADVDAATDNVANDLYRSARAALKEAGAE